SSIFIGGNRGFLWFFVFPFRLRLLHIGEQNKPGSMTSTFASDLPGDLRELFEVREPSVFVVRALHNLKRDLDWIPSNITEYDPFALRVALNNTRMRTGVAARFGPRGCAAINLSVAHTLTFLSSLQATVILLRGPSTHNAISCHSEQSEGPAPQLSKLSP